MKKNNAIHYKKNKNFIWLRTEYKRAAMMLPFILKRAMILAAVCLAAGGMIAFCAGVLRSAGNTEPKLRVGYVAEDNMLTQFAVSYVQEMESVQSLCSLESVTEQEGKTLLEEGGLSALIVLPKDIINEIISGNNAPAKLFLPQQEEGVSLSRGISTVGSMLFEELVSAGMGMLGTAQAEIYASSSILQELTAEYGEKSIENSLLQSMYDDINQFNLAVVTAREDLFHTKSLSVTENDTYAVYYGSAFLTIYMMLAGLFFGGYCKRSDFWKVMADRRIGVGYAAQFICRCLAGGMLMLVTALIPFLALAVPRVQAMLSFEITPAGVISLILITAFMTIYHMMIYQIVEKRESAIVVSGIMAILQAYMSGCLIPSVLLPDAIADAGRMLPASFIKKGFTVLLTGEARALLAVAEGLVVWGVALFLITVLFMHMGSGFSMRLHKGVCDGTGRDMRTRQFSARIHVPSVVMVCFRRLLHKRSIWFCLFFFAVLSVAIIQTEERSETRIKAAVYDDSGEFNEMLGRYDGLICFEIYEDREQVMDAVRRGDAECGYVLPRSLAQDMMSRRANGAVTVYQDADAVVVPVVNEVIFEQIFRQVSLSWYEKYIGQNEAVMAFGADRETLEEKVKDCFGRELSLGTTFHVEIEHVGMNKDTLSDMEKNENADSQKATYPVYLAAAIAVVLCVLQGVAQVIADIRNRNFYKRNRVAMSVLTIILPVLLGWAVLVLITVIL